MDDARELFGVWFEKRTGAVRRWLPAVGMDQRDADMMERVTSELPRIVGDQPTTKIPQVETPTIRLEQKWFGGTE